MSDDITDAPGQRCIYIPPGDTWKEGYRLSTFENFPAISLISPKSLAKSGFIFTGYRDRVKCFACGRAVEQWMEADNPVDAKWHKATCPFVTGEECGNVPLQSLFSNFSWTAEPVTNLSIVVGRSTNPDEEVLEQRDPNTGAIVRRVRYPSDLPERKRQTDGTFEIGANGVSSDHKRTQCFSCGGVLRSHQLENDTDEERRRLKDSVEVIKNMGFDKATIKAACQERGETVTANYIEGMIEGRAVAREDLNVDVFHKGTADLLNDVMRREQEEKERKKRVMSGKSQHLLVKDQNDIKYLVDTGSEKSIIPAPKGNFNSLLPTTSYMEAANGTRIKIYGTQDQELTLSNGKDYKWTFTIADVTNPVLGIDFLTFHNLWIQPDKRRLKDQSDGSYIYGLHRQNTDSSSGTFYVGHNNEVMICSGTGSYRQNPVHPSTPQIPKRPWRMANVISAYHKRFLTNLFLNRELDRLASFARWPVGRPNIAPAFLARSGFFYLGDMDRTQCFSCGGVLRNWKLEDNADVEHRTHLPQCPMVLRIEDRNIPVQAYPETEEEREGKYPCRFPSNPHLRSEISRLVTFGQHWPMGRTAATPEEIAQAGFFFIGQKDQVRCWYCNGFLHNWEYNDIPWIEHARWFPTCQFLLRVKGQHFVYRHLAAEPHLPRPFIMGQDASPLENAGQRGHNRKAETRSCKQRVAEYMKSSDVVKFVVSMGFWDKIVAAVLEDRINSGDAANRKEIYESASDLLDDVLKKEEELGREEEERQSQSPAPSISVSNVTSGLLIPASGRHNGSYDEGTGQDLYGGMELTCPTASLTQAKQLQEEDNSSESLRKALEAISEEKLCKICSSNQADMVFIPCRHSCCCMDCTQAINQCPICRKPIQKVIKTYLN